MPSSTRRRVVIYARQSVTRDGSESLTSQVEQCERAAERLGLEVVTTLVEPPSTSGYRDRGRRRPRFRDLLDLVRRGEADVVMAYATDRLSRGGGPGWAPLLEALEAAGLDTDRAVATPMGFVSEFELGIRAAMDREASRKTASLVADSHASRARAGRPKAGGPRPFGYEDDHRTVRPAEAKELRKAIERLLAGETLNGIARDWNARGILPTGGTQWRGSTVRQVLGRPRNWGMREHRGQVVGLGDWQPIIDREIGERVLAVLRAGGRRTNGGVTARRYLLPGLVRCALCNTALTSRPADGHHRRSYVCAVGPARGCGRIRVAAEPLEELVMRAALRHLDSSRLANAIAGRDRADGVGAAISTEEAKLEQLARDFADDLIGRAEWLAARQQVGGRLQQLRRRLVADTRLGALADLAGRGGELAAVWDTLTLDQQRAVVGTALESVAVGPSSSTGRRVLEAKRVKVRRRLG